MKLHFDPNQQYQLDAINSIVGIFEGQPLNRGDFGFSVDNEKTVYFVAETKSAGQELRISEKQKIKCGYAHFNEFEDVKYRQVATVGELD